VAHQARAYPGFCSMKRLGVFLLPGALFGETPLQVPEVNDCLSLVGKDVEADKDNKYRTCYGHAIRRPKRL